MVLNIMINQYINCIGVRNFFKNTYLYFNFSEIQEKVCKLANNLKSKSAVTEDDLQTLYSVMAADSSHISTFLKVGGSLRGLVGELTGNY